jgi:N-acetylmuramoyl-L-alanine amidase
MPHTVAPGETLWSIAAANNLHTNALAVYNGLSPDSQVVLGSTIQVPSADEALVKVNESLTEQAVAAQSGGAQAASTAASTGAPPPPGAYQVQPGDTFSELAARAGVRPEQVAGVNGLSLDQPLIAGTTIKLPPASAPVQQAQPPSAPQNVPASAPAPAPGRVTSDQIHQAAAQHGVDGSLAAAIAWQESGFNNAMVSAANARGVMQVMPGTWDWVQRNLTDHQLDPTSAADNVHAGTMYLGQLLKETRGDPALAAAAYYQGLSSVRKIGMLPETRRYVDNVMALRSRFGG